MSMLVGRVNISNCLQSTPFLSLLFPFTLPLQFAWFASCSPEQCRQVHAFLCIHTYTSAINNISRWSPVSVGITAHDISLLFLLERDRWTPLLSVLMLPQA